MTTAKTVVAVAGANAVAIEGTKAASPSVPFLDVPLWTMEISGVLAVMTPQALIVVMTGILSIVALCATIAKRVTA